MANLVKDTFSASAALTCTLASLPSSTTFAGKQTTLIDNSSSRYALIRVYGKITQGTSPTGNRGVYLFWISSDDDATTPHRDDAAGASDANWTRANSDFIQVGRNLASPATGQEIFVSGWIVNPGPEFGVGIYHDTGVNLNSTGSNHWLRWIGFNPEVQ